MSSYPSFNDATPDLVKKIVENTATLVDSPAFGVNPVFNSVTIRGPSATINGASGDSGVVVRTVKKVTAIADNTATTVFTVTVPNAGHAAGIRLSLVSTNGSTDAYESTRVAEGFVAIARTSGVATVAVVATLALAQIATVAAGATHTLAYSVTAMTGAVGATQTFDIQVTVNDTGNVGGNIVLAFAELMNVAASGITIA